MLLINTGLRSGKLEQCLPCVGMRNTAKIEISGNIAEIIDNNSNQFARVVCNNKNMIIQLDQIDDISLGDKIVLKGELLIKKIELRGIEIELNKK